ncbi:MBL fold metallo-hydrolase [Ideonella sp.]|uniref:MBL fold metallo-hydrolase n=1 Tax=Ideonella sp. TaxID=1929293 RepID=UPI002B485FA2|nr:MBL fold metallo-hydrolase [Ideonella sp.]HJV68349.1 MBL fold metallo-hydrolase [Ideonella sp.]
MSELAPAASAALTIDRDAQGARRAASVIVLRDGASGAPEVLLLRRAEREGDMRSGVWVFPGGVLDEEDAALGERCHGDSEVAANDRLGLPHGALAYTVAALRECFEEVGLLYAADGDVEAALHERELVRTGADFAALCARHGLRLDAGALAYHSHWLTPPGLPKRFDTRFFVARAPHGQQAVVDAGEALELAWLTPAQALESERGESAPGRSQADSPPRGAAAAAQPPGGTMKLLPVTRETLKDLARFASVAEVLAEAHARRHPPRMMPRLGRDAAGRVRPVLPGEWAYAEIGRLDPEGRGTVCFELPPLAPVRLSERVTRITCANGSVMTGPGTNTYLVRAPGGAEVTVIDPGPDDAHTEAHLQAVLGAAAPGRIVRIVTTHTHKDHSPGARRLAELTGAPVIGRVADHGEWQDTAFAPRHMPIDGERIVLGAGATLRAVATPGHASNHVCWLLEEEGLLFTGDHVMQGSTVVINPPDGDMATYLASLDKLLALDGLRWFAPGHGFLMAEPQAEVRKLIAHRLGREAKVAAALRAAGAASAEALVPTVYGDVPSARHGIAARSLTAHLIKLAADGRARRDGDLWHWQEQP